jgi:hypothetical protein
MAAPMLELTTTDAVAAKIAGGRSIVAQAYTVHGPVLRALETAARRGARVSVRLEGNPYEDRKGSLARENARLAGELRASGADAALAQGLHAKEVDVDGVRYLDEKNWRQDDLVVRVPGAAHPGAVAEIKHEALAREAQLLRKCGGSGDAIVESESFGCCNAVYGALRALAREGAAPRLLVAGTDLHGNARERGALERLERDGVRVRVCKDSEKLAAAGNGAWLGSANATVAFGESDTIDWGACTRSRPVVAAVRARLQKTWDCAKELHLSQPTWPGRLGFQTATHAENVRMCEEFIKQDRRKSSHFFHPSIVP